MGKIIRFEARGPEATGLQEMPLDGADFQSELPQQQIHVYYEDELLGLSVGVWTTTSMQEAFGPYPGDEFMWVLEGEVCMVDAQGAETRIRQGETFCIRNAIPVSWKQDGFLRKFYMTYADPEITVPRIESAEGGVIVLDAVHLEAGKSVMETTDPFAISGVPPVQHDSSAFTNDTGNLFVGMWDSSAFVSEMRPFPCHEMAQILEGDIVIEEADGSRHEFTAGDAFFVPMGTECRWHCDSFVKKFYSILEPPAGASGVKV